MKVLLTGSTGFLGGWLASHLLESNFDVITIRSGNRQNSNRQQSRFTLEGFSDRCRDEVVDIRDFASIERIVIEHKPSIVIHMAAVGDVTVAADNPKSTFEVSANGTLNLLEALRLHSPDSLFISHTTDKVYSGNQTPFCEKMLFNPTHVYEAAKVSQEHLTRIYADSYGLKTVTVRCGNYFGGYDFNFNRIIPYVIRQVIENEKIELRSSGDFTRDFLYIEDAVLVNKLLIDDYLEHGDGNVRHGEAYNFSLEIELSVLQVVQRILSLMNSDLPIVISNGSLSEIPNMVLSCNKAQQELNWKPTFSFDEGLLRTIDFYESHYA